MLFWGSPSAENCRQRNLAICENGEVSHVTSFPRWPLAAVTQQNWLAAASALPSHRLQVTNSTTGNFAAEQLVPLFVGLKDYCWSHLACKFEILNKISKHIETQMEQMTRPQCYSEAGSLSCCGSLFRMIVICWGYIRFTLGLHLGISPVTNQWDSHWVPGQKKHWWMSRTFRLDTQVRPLQQTPGTTLFRYALTWPIAEHL